MRTLYYKIVRGSRGRQWRRSTSNFTDAQYAYALLLTQIVCKRCVGKVTARRRPSAAPLVSECHQREEKRERMKKKERGGTGGGIQNFIPMHLRSTSVVSIAFVISELSPLSLVFFANTLFFFPSLFLSLFSFFSFLLYSLPHTLLPTNPIFLSLYFPVARSLLPVLFTTKSAFTIRA